MVALSPLQPKDMSNEVRVSTTPSEAGLKHLKPNQQIELLSAINPWETADAKQKLIVAIAYG